MTALVYRSPASLLALYWIKKLSYAWILYSKLLIGFCVLVFNSVTRHILQRDSHFLINKKANPFYSFLFFERRKIDPFAYTPHIGSTVDKK